MNRLGTLRHGLAMGAATIGMAAGAWGQTPPAVEPDKQPASAPGTTPPVPSVPPAGAEKPPQADRRMTDRGIDIWTEARYVLEKELEVVKGLNSVRGEAESIWEHSIEGQPPLHQEFTLHYAIQKPEKVFIETKDIKAFVDGTSVTVYCKSLKQYVKRPMPDIWLLRETLEELSGGQIRNIPGEAMLRTGLRLEQTLRGVNSVEHARTGEYQGKQGTWVTGTALDDRQPGSGGYLFERWYSDEDHLMRVLKQDMTQMYQGMAEMIAREESEAAPTPKKAPRYLQVGMTTTYKRELNAKLPPETFVFAPEPGDRKVEQFVWNIHPQVKDQIAMLGKPAPELVGKDFDGQDVDVGSFKGKVVVLDFWATWRGPSCASLPSMQMIKEKYADKPFVLIGMNREHAGDERKVKPFLGRRRVTIQQFNDIEGKAATAFFTTTSIPCVVIIDAQGNVADIENGYLPGKEKELMAKLDKMFAGKPVHTAEEIAALNEQMGPVKGN